ncbi:MAG: MBL fold metallo-hydrolase RNA specificity domain-containing protein, partial [Salinarimonas sp.]
LDGVKPFRSADAYDRLQRDKVVVLLTGSQGEPRAALARIARDDHPAIALAAGDRVVFSSRQIPGNEKAIGSIMNQLAQAGIGIVTDADGLVHVSGHPRRGEMRMMYEWLKPACVIPAHGEAVHIAEHARFARSCGVPHTVVAKDGAMVRLAPGTPEIVDHVKVGRLYKDGEIVIGEDDRALPERRKLAVSGIVTVAIAIDSRGEIQGDPAVDVMGLPLLTKAREEIIDIIADAIGRTLDGLPRGKRRDSDFVETAVARAVRSAVNGQWGKKPACHVLVVEV